MGKNYSKLMGDIQPLAQLVSYIGASVNLSEWMAQLPMELLDVPLIYLAIPGSHNSMTYTITKFAKMAPDVGFLFNNPIPVCVRPLIYRWCKTQASPIGSQLEDGIRYLDLRVSSKKGSQGIFIVHGMYGGDVVKELLVVKEFLDRHPKEIIIIDFQHFYAMGNSHHDQLVKNIKEIFENKICPVPSKTLVEKATLSYMYSKNHQVIVIYRSNRQDELFWSGSTWPTHWPDTMSIKEMVRVCEENVQERRGNVGLISQGVLTAQPATAISPTGNVKNSCAKKALVPMLEWLNHCYKENLLVNIVIADYVHFESHLFTKGVISLNYRKYKFS